MTDPPHRVHVETVRWLEVFAALRLFRSLPQSLAPARLFLALLLVVLLYLGGKGLDFVWGDRVKPEEFARYALLEPADVGTGAAPVFQTLLHNELIHFNRMVNDAVALNFGLTELLTGRRGGVIGELRTMIVTLPAWVLGSHTGFSIMLLAYAFVLTMILGGAIARLAGLDACRGQRPWPFEALIFAIGKGGWFIAAPLLPLALVALLAVMLALAGLVFFNLPVLDVIGGLLFGLLLILGSLAAALLLAAAVIGPLLTPAIAIEDSDAFDAVGRSFSYVLAHPWRYVVYLGTMLVYGAIGYLLVGLVLFLTLWATRTFVSLLVFAETAGGLGRFDAILPDPRLGRLHVEPVTEQLGASGKAAAALVGVWVKLLLALLPAYCVSFYFTASTWIYLLLRHHTDGAAFGEIALRDRAATTVPDKIEPAAAAESHADAQ